jgi:hypothetical protein
MTTPDVTPEVTPYVIDCPRCGHCCPQRQWVGLTDEDKQELEAERHSWGSLVFAVEAKLKEKNT